MGGAECHSQLHSLMGRGEEIRGFLRGRQEQRGGVWHGRVLKLLTHLFYSTCVYLILIVFSTNQWSAQVMFAQYIPVLISTQSYQIFFFIELSKKRLVGFYFMSSPSFPSSSPYLPITTSFLLPSSLPSPLHFYLYRMFLPPATPHHASSLPSPLPIFTVSLPVPVCSHHPTCLSAPPRL